jgi:hypothetical protein
VGQEDLIKLLIVAPQALTINSSLTTQGPRRMKIPTP